MLGIFLSKFLPLLVYPVGLVAILLLVAVLLRKQRGWATGLLLLALAVLFIGGNRWVAVSLARSLEWHYLPQSTTPKADVVVLLGGGTEPGQAPRQGPELNSAGDRVLYARRLYQAGAAPHILLSGGNTSLIDDSSSSPAADMAELLTSMDVPASALWLEDKSQNTVENASFAWKVLSEKKIKRIILVTSAMHMPRAVQLFEAQGFDVIAAPCDYSVTETTWNDLMHPSWPTLALNILPSVSNLSITTNVMKEYIGMAMNGF
jgi:uncharacterized SAM-binding protein YcdF (DUF218 family)